MSLYEMLRAAVAASVPAVLATLVLADDPVAGPLGAKLLVTLDPDGRPIISGSLGDPDLDRVVARDSLAELDAGRSGIRHYGPHGEAREDTVSIFIDSFAPPPRMLIFGAVDFTSALVRVAKVLGYHVTVCDAREVFATEVRFPLADEVVVDWPHRLLEREGATLRAADAVCVLTHDHKFDVPAIAAALRTDVGYIGAMGSRRTAEERSRRLIESGVSDRDLIRVMAPIGLDIGARSPEETAIAICSEIISTRTGRTPSSLRDAVGPIHSRIA
jgi:xanthine dehydrogenase accessory factor